MRFLFSKGIALTGLWLFSTGCEGEPPTPTPLADAPVLSQPSSLRCTRETVQTAPASLFDELRAQLKSAKSEEERRTLVRDFIGKVDAQGGTPLTEPARGRAVFVALGNPAVSYSAAGTWNNWKAGATLLLPVEGTELYAADVRLPVTSGHQYKLLDGSRWFQDLRAQHVAWDGIDRLTVGEFNAVVFPSFQDTRKGRLQAIRHLPSRHLGDVRDVFVYVPAGYDAADCPVLPTMYFHDGNEALTRAPFHLAAEAFFEENPEQAALMVFVSLAKQEGRMSEYTFGENTRGDSHVAFLEEELVPRIEGEFRTCPQAAFRGVAGASLGGLISTYAAFQRPSLFSFVGAQSASLFWGNDALLQRARLSPVLPLRFYVDHGTPADNSAVSRRFVEILRGKGYDVLHVEAAGARHEWPAWQARLPGLLSHFRKVQTSCPLSVR